MKQKLRMLLVAAARSNVGVWCLRHMIPRMAVKLPGLHPPITADPRNFAHVFECFMRFTRLPKSDYCLNLDLVKTFCSVPGCVVECGVWRGGMIAGMATILGNEREYYLFDSFEGLPPAATIDGNGALEWQAANRVDNCRTAESFAHEAMKRARTDSFHVVGGWFVDTLKTFQPAQRIAILRLDADWYSSTMECLNFLYHQVIPGGIIIVDDYYAWDGCARALHDFLSANRLRDRIRQHKGAVCYLVKEEDTLIRSVSPTPESSL